ncbi:MULTISPECIES: hypothetical protein [Paenarthrobacter]|uniref:hypothetical protein n=1 Tax=Paenarthrobacter TaxID=1742992 RepID=UPI001BABE1EF|nr:MULTISPECIES: hypothetical protein [Paenarthrobacter]MDR6638396.1 hypothetical protein [Paenarthrobacter nitroguajacolicus]WOH18503.1 hypothetical protein IRJ34_19480 [Paenarthrobacter sp. GOM3]
MPDQITAISVSTGPALVTSDPLAGTADAARHTGEVPGQARAVVSVREQFNPLGVGLRSIWPQSVVGF